MRSKMIAGCGTLVIVIGMFQGCAGTPQMSSPNRKILESLQTAVSAKKPEWLAAVEDQVSKKRTSHEMSDTEFKAVNAILKKAKSGDWKQALKDSFQLSEGQRPSAQEFASLKSRQPSKLSVQN